jgi:hypothetical protein
MPSSLQASSSNSPNESDDWLQASDWDEPLEIALLYKDVIAKNGCGHAMQWNPHKLVDCKLCPACQEPVVLICDGSSGNPSQPCIAFKYGKQIYRLSVDNKNTPPAPQSLWKSWIISWMSPQSNEHNNPVTAQDRIQQALGLVGLKVLHKGKILYPSSSLEPQQISKRLLEVSDADWHEHPKASLVVMGTLQGRELKGPPTKKTAPWTLKQFLFLPWNIVHWSLHCSWLFFRTFLTPFLPLSLTSGDDEDHPHQD